MTSVLRRALPLLLVACSSHPPAGTNGPPAGPSATASDSSELPRVRDAGDAPPPAVSTATTDEAPAVPSFDEIARALFADRSDLSGVVSACPSNLGGEARVRCAYDERYRGDAHAANLAHELFVRWRIVAGVEVAHTMDGGYRGRIRLEPALPLHADRKHLEWIVGALRDLDAFFIELDRYAAASKAVEDGGAHPNRYRWKPLTLRFVRSVAARTPSAYAHDWTVAWNLAGSLHTSADAVRETMVHEIFHLNDYAHPPGPGEPWSPAALGPTFDAIVRKCGTAAPCLGPYTPNDTMVRGGTYYSFQPGNGVREYAAELALRYYREQRAVLRGLPKVKPFKCGPPENARAWARMRDEFFDGVDAVPPCS